MVELLMDRKTLRGVVIGLCLLAVLSFAAGLTLGIRRSLPSTSTAASTHAFFAAAVQVEPAASGTSQQASFSAADRDRLVLPALVVRTTQIDEAPMLETPMLETPARRPSRTVVVAPAFEPQVPGLRLDGNRRLAYTVQAGAFVNRGNAQAQAQTLAGRGYATRVVGVRVASGRVFALVLVGGYAGFSEAVRTAATLDAEGFSAFARSNVAGEESHAASGVSG